MHSQLSTLKNRRGVSLIEMVVVVLMVAIGASVAVPKWGVSLNRTRANCAAQMLERDISSLRRHAVGASTELKLTFASGRTGFTISPPTPSIAGDSSGVVNYAERFPGITLHKIDFDGEEVVTIDIFGDLISPFSALPIGRAVIGIRGNDCHQSVDLILGGSTN